MKKKRWSVFLGVSMLAGLLGSSFAHSKKIESNKLTFKPYTGTWQFNHKFLKMKHLLTIEENGTIFWDQRPLSLELIKHSNYQLIFRDKYGFILVVTYINPQSITLYDEAEDFTYQLTKIIPT